MLVDKFGEVCPGDCGIGASHSLGLRCGAILPMALHIVGKEAFVVMLLEPRQ
jgi:hypothetical protein